MTIFEQTFRDLLIAANLVDTRVFFWRAPQVPAEQAKVPYVIFFQVGPDNSAYTMGGPLTMVDRDYQVAIYDPSQSRCTAIADSLRAHLDGYHETYKNVRFGATFYHSQTSTFEADTKLFVIMQDLSLIHI